MTTDQNLRDSLSGESQANRKYLAFAKKAEEDGYKGVALLFRAIAEAETIHAMTDIRLLKTVNSTEENLKAAITGENYETSEMYPKFAKEAAAEKNDLAARYFGYDAEVEKGHEELFKKALALILGKKDMPIKSVFVCANCGHTSEEDPGVCPICGATEFKEIK